MVSQLTAKELDSLLLPGTVGVNLKGKADALGTFTTLAQGDTEAAHVWRVRRDGTIATTGGKMGVLFDFVEPVKYLRGKTFYLLQPVDPFTAPQLAIMDYADWLIKRQPVGRAYGFWRYWQLWGKALVHGAVDSLGDPGSNPPRFPICSQAVAYALWKAGAPVGKGQGKRDWTAVLPETFLREAKQVGFELASGSEFRKPCYFLRTTTPEAVQF